MILGLVHEAVSAGARQSKTCEVLELDRRTVQRWKQQSGGDDRRRGPTTPPAHRLTAEEQERILKLVNEPRFRDLCPHQIVARLADEGEYLASESTIYRLLHRAGQQKHRDRSRPPHRRARPPERVATAPGQVWSWDITWLPTEVRGLFYKLYMIEDVFSRKIVGWSVHDQECAEYASQLIQETCRQEGLPVEPSRLFLHADNGGPMKGATMLATLQRLGIVPSFSRPRVSNDNPYSESTFRTMKYRPEYPERPFRTLDDAKQWVERFVRWYNHEHRHSGIHFVTPQQRHEGQDRDLLRGRRRVYEAARRRHPRRWTRSTRRWPYLDTVVLNLDPEGSHRVA